ncbi:hypothetical protein AB0K52_24035 [Glycomyces sp. NPDC049804]
MSADRSRPAAVTVAAVLHSAGCVLGVALLAVRPAREHFRKA